MVPVSIVIITKNEADILTACVNRAKQITDDIVVICNDTADEPDVYLDGCSVFKRSWDGYGANKNKGIAAAKYNWILSIDADEVPDDMLIASLHQLNFNNPAVIYDVKFRPYFGGKVIRYGGWGRDHHVRLFNRTLVKWSETVVHETLMLPVNAQIKKINGCMHHYSVKDVNEYNEKGRYYAKLSAKKYFNAGKRASMVKLYLSPAFGFIKNYICLLGFLDGHQGWDIARTSVKNTYRKYHFLSQIEEQQKKQVYKDTFVVEY